MSCIRTRFESRSTKTGQCCHLSAATRNLNYDNDRQILGFVFLIRVKFMGNKNLEVLFLHEHKCVAGCSLRRDCFRNIFPQQRLLLITHSSTLKEPHSFFRVNRIRQNAIFFLGQNGRSIRNNGVQFNAHARYTKNL